MLRHYAASNELILGHIAHLAGAEEAALAHYQRAAQLLPDDDAIQHLAQSAYGKLNGKPQKSVQPLSMP